MRSLTIAIFLLFSLSACRERYGLPMEPSLNNLLVVEGNILNGDTTKVRLSRTSSVSERGLIAEPGASVQIEGDDNSAFPLVESTTEPGLYKSDYLTLNNSRLYRLKIATGGKEYESEWVAMLNTPDIDNVTWRRDERDNGVEILVASQGTADDARYYKWDYDEVWEFHPFYEAKAYFNYTTDEHGNHHCAEATHDGITYTSCVEPFWYPTWLLRRNDSMYFCWKYQNSTNINIGSTAASSENNILATVRKIEINAWELSWLYSINVKQTGLSKEGYQFYKILKGNSEGMGSIFDAQPSQMKTNIKCVTNPSEIVIGFVDATNVKTKRLFIGAPDVPDWRYYYSEYNCTDNLVERNLTFQQMIDFDIVPTNITDYDSLAPFQIKGYEISYRACADCRLRGVHRKPDFWP